MKINASVAITINKENSVPTGLDGVTEAAIRVRADLMSDTYHILQLEAVSKFYEDGVALMGRMENGRNFRRWIYVYLWE